MGTSADIGIELNNGTVCGIGLNYDGYLSSAGRILLAYYDADATFELMSLGDLSELGRSPDRAPEGADRREYHELTGDPKYCLAYGRDLGEADEGPRTYADLDEYFDDCCGDFTYLFRESDNTWYQVHVAEDGSFTRLAEAVEDDFRRNQKP
jgi:hypothetical protein